MAQVEAEVGQAPTMTGAQLAQSIVSNLTQHGTFSTAEEDQRIGRLALVDLSRGEGQHRIQPGLDPRRPAADRADHLQARAAVGGGQGLARGPGQCAAGPARRPPGAGLGVCQLWADGDRCQPRRRAGHRRHPHRLRQRRAAEFQAERERPGPGGNPRALRRRPGRAVGQGPAGRQAGRPRCCARAASARTTLATPCGCARATPASSTSRSDATRSRSGEPPGRRISTSSCS